MKNIGKPYEGKAHVRFDEEELELVRATSRSPRKFQFFTLQDEYGGVQKMWFNPNDLSIKAVYKLLAGTVVPRPIAWVSTISTEKILNLAPFSFFTVASKDPPMLCISIGQDIGERKGVIKDTLKNIIDTQEFVINIVSKELLNQMHQSSGNYDADINEFEIVGVSPVESKIISPPRVKESPINMECKLEQIIQLGTDHLVIGRLVCYHIADEIYMDNFKVNHEILKPVARLAGNYSWIEKTFKI